MKYKKPIVNDNSRISIFLPKENQNKLKNKNSLHDLESKKSRERETHYKFDELQSLLEKLFSTEDKKILLEQIRDEVNNIHCSLFEILKDGDVLNELLNIFNIGKISYSKLLLQFFQNLLDNSPEFASFITCNEDTFYSLLSCEPFQSDLFILFTKVIKEIPEFADNLQKNDIIPLLFDVCYKIQECPPEDLNVELIQSISSLINIIIEKEKLFSEIYETDEARLDISIKLSSIAHSLLACLQSLLDFTEKNSENKHEYKKTIEEYYTTILHPTLLLIEALCYSKLPNVYQLFDEDTGIMIYIFFEKGKYVKDISEILLSFAKNFPNEAFNFLDQFDLLSLLFRHGRDVRYQWDVIKVLIAYAEISASISNSIFEYEFLSLFEDQIDKTLSSEKIELILCLFCVLCINVPQSMASLTNLETYFEKCMDNIDSSNNNFVILFLRAIESMLNQREFYIDQSIDCDELGEKLDFYLTNSDEPEIIALSKQILPALQE